MQCLDNRGLRSAIDFADEVLGALGRDGQQVEVAGAAIDDAAGAAALDLAYVAAGYYDGFWEVGLNPWDVAAGSLLILEAGGLVGDLAGDAEYLYGGQIIAANPRIFAQMVKLLSPYRESLPPVSRPLTAET